jgi:succinate dehydrogenase/fumarate reductase flavoprotein subunit
MPDAVQEFDFIVIGSGAASVCAAIAMKDAGLSALIIEKEKFFGGSTALSGGVLWIPNNPLQHISAAFLCGSVVAARRRDVRRSDNR